VDYNAMKKRLKIGDCAGSKKSARQICRARYFKKY